MRPACNSRPRTAAFQTFADPVVLNILPSLTGLVGPDGCSKGNFVNALGWAMGEGNQAVDALTLGIRQHPKPVDLGNG